MSSQQKVDSAVISDVQEMSDTKKHGYTDQDDYADD